MDFGRSNWGLYHCADHRAHSFWPNFKRLSEDDVDNIGNFEAYLNFAHV